MMPRLALQLVRQMMRRVRLLRLQAGEEVFASVMVRLGQLSHQLQPHCEQPQQPIQQNDVQRAVVTRNSQ
jgi:hypothetical protein